jgi:hypothetical protein
MKKEYWKRINRNKAKRKNKKLLGRCGWYKDFTKLYNYWNGYTAEY